MKRIISILLILCMLSVLLVSCSNSDDTNPDDGKQTISSQYSKGLAFEPCENNPSQCIITGIGSCTDKNIVIPAFINGMKVVGIKDGAFSPKTQLLKGTKEVTQVLASEITDSMISSNTVNTDAKPSNSIIFDNYITNMSPSFNGGLLQGPNAENYETGTGTPVDLESIESVKIPSSVTEIGDEAFYGCEDLNSINAPTSLSAIGKDAFKETAYYNNPQNWENGQALYLSNYLLYVSSDYTGEFTVREGTTAVADQAFYKCTYITTVNMADSVTTVGNFAFYGCTNLVTYNFSASTNIKYSSSAFDGCFNMTYKPYLPGNTTNTPSYDDVNDIIENKYPKNFDTISKEEFDSLKENINTNYSSETTYNNSKDKEILWVDNGQYYYTLAKDGAIVTELYGETDENGIVAYMYVDHKLYFTSAEIPNKIALLNGLEFEDLCLYNESTNTYAYFESKDSEERIELGFKSGKGLVYLKVVIGDDEATTYFYDFGKTNAPATPKGDLVQGVIVDENGNIK